MIVWRTLDPTVHIKLTGAKVYNNSGSDIASGSLVYISGWSSTGNAWLITLADSTIYGARAQFVLRQTIKNGTSGYINGAQNICASYWGADDENSNPPLTYNTNSNQVGDPVYLGTAGGISLTAPDPTKNAIQIVGRVLQVSSTAGQIRFDMRENGAAPMVMIGAVDIPVGAVGPSSLGLAVINKSGSTLAQYQLVYVNSFDATSGRFTVVNAANNVSGSRATYIVTASAGIANNATGTVAVSVLTSATLNTGGSTVGNPVYLGTAGAWTLTAPTAANAINQIVGRVAVVNASTGQILFDLDSLNQVTFGTNELQTNSVTAAKLTTTLATGWWNFDLASLRVMATNDYQNTAANGGIVSLNTAPSIQRVSTSTDKGARLTWAATVVAEVQVNFFIPPDLDNTQPVTMNFKGQMNGSTDTPTVAIGWWEGVGGSNLGGNTAALSNVAQTLTVAITSAAPAGSKVAVTLVPGSHGTNAVQLDTLYVTYTRK